MNSATPEEPLHRVVVRRGWRPFFKDVLGRPRSKVDNLRAVLLREACSPSSLAFVGDSPRDRHAAAIVGCPFVAFGGLPAGLPPEALGIADLSMLEAMLAALHHARRP